MTDRFPERRLCRWSAERETRGRKLVLDRMCRWHRTRFEPTDATGFQWPAVVWIRQVTGIEVGSGRMVRDG